MPRTMKWIAAVFCAAWLAAWGVPLSGAVDQAALDRAFEALQEYDWGRNHRQLAAIDEAIVESHGDAEARERIEQRLVAVLESDAKRAAKQVVCRKLSIVGTEDAVPALAACLGDEELSHMARFALERMPYPAAAKAMRDTLPKVSGELKVGLINSLGRRRDADSTALLIPLLKAEDPKVAGAAAAALGKIATSPAAEALMAFRNDAPEGVRDAITDACLDVAARLFADGRKEAAARIYEMLDHASEPQHVRLAAFRGLVAARPDGATRRLLKALTSTDPQLRGLAAGLIREMPGQEATRALAEALGELPPDSQVVLLDALGDRGDPVARPAVNAGLKSPNSEVRAAALRAMSTIGTAEDVPMLAREATSGGSGGEAARHSLAELGAPHVNAAIVREIEESADPAVKVVLFSTLVARYAFETVDVVLAAARNGEPAVREAALDALAVLAKAEHADELVALLRAAKTDAERTRAHRAIMALCSRAGKECTDPLVAGLEGAKAAVRAQLLLALGRVGGERALAVVRDATKDPDPDVRTEAVRVLANWSDPAAASHLLKIAESSKKRIHRILALRGYVRLVHQQEAPDQLKLRALERAMGLARDADSRKRVLAALADVHTVESLNLVMPHVGTAAVNEEACLAATRIGEHVWQENKDFVRGAMNKVIRNTKNPPTRAAADKVLGKMAAKPK